MRTPSVSREPRTRNGCVLASPSTTACCTPHSHPHSHTHAHSPPATDRRPATGQRPQRPQSLPLDLVSSRRQSQRIQSATHPWATQACNASDPQVRRAYGSYGQLGMTTGMGKRRVRGWYSRSRWRSEKSKRNRSDSVFPSFLPSSKCTSCKRARVITARHLRRSSRKGEAYPPVVNRGVSWNTLCTSRCESRKPPSIVIVPVKERARRGR